MSTVAVNIGCTTYYQVNLCFGYNCFDACDCTSTTTYYSTCEFDALFVGCQLYTSDGTDAPLGYYSDGFYCYQYDVSSEISQIVARTACTSSYCSCMGFSVSSCATACSNYNSYCVT